MLVEELVPAIDELPGVLRTLVLWSTARDTEAPPVYCQVLIEFHDASARSEMMDSPAREKLRPRVREAAAMFDGGLFHVEYRVDPPS